MEEQNNGWENAYSVSIIDVSMYNCFLLIYINYFSGN